jgi:hypothetical protein
MGALKVAHSTVANWVNRPDFPGGKHGPWELAKVVAYVQDMRAGSKARDGSHEATAFEDLGQGGGAKAGNRQDSLDLKRRVETQLLAENLKRARGLVVPRDEVAVMLAARMRELTRMLGAVARRLGRKLQHRALDAAFIEAEVRAEHERVMWSCYGRDEPGETVDTEPRERQDPAP